MRPFSATASPLEEFGFAGRLLMLLLWPIRLLLALVQWLLVEVVARVPAMILMTWDAIWIHRQAARQRMLVAREAKLLQQQEREAMRVVRAPFLEALRLIEEFDRRQATLDPRFVSSLQASRAICDAVIATVPELAADPIMQERLREGLERLFLIEQD